MFSSVSAANKVHPLPSVEVQIEAASVKIEAASVKKRPGFFKRLARFAKKSFFLFITNVLIVYTCKNLSNFVPENTKSYCVLKELLEFLLCTSETVFWLL